jgi:hypothetical protein
MGVILYYYCVLYYDQKTCNVLLPINREVGTIDSREWKQNFLLNTIVL